MPLMPAIRPVSSINSTAERPISAPPIAADTGVKLAMAKFRRLASAPNHIAFSSEWTRFASENASKHRVPQRIIAMGLLFAVAHPPPDRAQHVGIIVGPDPLVVFGFGLGPFVR